MAKYYDAERSPVVEDGVDLSKFGVDYMTCRVYWWDPEQQEGVAWGWDGLTYDYIYFTAQDFGRLPMLVAAGSQDSGIALAERTDDPMRLH